MEGIDVGGRWRMHACALMVLCLMASPMAALGGPPTEGDPTVLADGGPQWVLPAVPDSGGRFTENLGQWDDGVAFVTDTSFGRAGLCEDGVVYDVVGEEGGHRVKVAFVTDSDATPRGVGDLGYPTNYLIGNDPEGWVRGARSYREVVYPDVWPGIDVRYYHAAGDIKYDILLGGDADPSDVRFRISGAEGMTVSDAALGIRLSGGLGLQDGDLVAWYGDGEAVDVSFVRHGDGYGFDVDKEAGRSLVIDPVVVHSSTLLGGIYDDTATSVEIDSEGNLVVASHTGSTDFPVTEGAYDEESLGFDVAITKMTHNGSRILWSTFVGGSSFDFLTGMDIDDEDAVYFAGQTWSIDFPTTKGAICPEFNLGMNDDQLDPFLGKLNPQGTDLVYATYLGGSSTEWTADLKVYERRATVVGSTHSYDFPTEYGSYGGVHGDGFLVIVSENGTAIEDTHFWGGFGSEALGSLEYDKNGDIVVGGRTTSGDMFTTPGVIQPTSAGFGAGFVARYSPKEDGLVMSTYFGGGGGASVGKVTVDDDLNVYISGMVQPGGFGHLPITTPGAFDEEYNGWADSFLAKVNPNATELEYCTLLGGDGREDFVYDLDVDGDGNLVAVGAVEDGTNFTVTEGCHDPVWAGDSEGYIFVLNANGSAPVYSSFHGGERRDSINDVDIDDADNWVIAGGTDSMDIPINGDAFQTKLVGGTDSIVSIIGELSPTSEPLNVTANDGEGSISVHWDAPADLGGYPVKRYLLYRGTSEDTLRFYEDVGRARSYVDTEVEWGVYYHYALIANNGKGISPRSETDFARSVTVPDRPLNLTGTVGEDGVHLSWEPPGFTGGLPLLGYYIYRIAEGDHMELVIPLEGNVTSFHDGAVKDVTDYNYALAARNAFGESTQRAELTLRTFGVPSPPTGLDHTYGDLFIHLTWGRPLTDNGLPVTGYVVHRTTGDGPMEEVARTTAKDRSYMDGDVEVGVTYNYTVTAENAKGPSLPTALMQATARVPPGPPADAWAEALEHFVKVTWSPSDFDGASPVLGYRVYLGATLDDAVCLGGPNVAGVTDPQLFFLHDVAYDGVVRSYFVTAFNAEGESPPSPLAHTVAYQVPEPPRYLEVIWGDGALEVSWEPPASDGGTPILMYTLYRQMEGGPSFRKMAKLSVDQLSFTDLDVLNGVEYIYWVTATNLAGEGEPTPVQGAVPAGPPGAPLNILAEGGVGTVHVTWAPPTSDGGHALTGYTVFRRSGDGDMGALLQLDGTTQELWDDQVVPGVVYTYAVTARTDAGESGRSEAASAMPYGPPGAPEGLVAYWVDGRVQLSWSLPSDDGGRPVLWYYVGRDDRDPENLTEVQAPMMTLMDDVVEAGRSYNYTVWAHNSAGTGPGTVVSITIPLPEPPAPESSESSRWAFLVVALVLLAVAGLLIATRRKGGTPGMALL